MTRILIVDDNQQNLYMLEILIQSQGYVVLQAENGAEALELARRDPPDLIISDILMPVMDGFALCREWKRDEQLNSVPFVFYTATYTDPQDEEFALSLGAERFITKPQEPELFMVYIEEVLASHKAGRMVAQPKPERAEEIYFKEYNQALIRKLEDKLIQLEEANQALEVEIEQRVQAQQALIEAHDKLEERVKERTDDLNMLVNSMAGREVRMAELKKVIKKLRAQLIAAGIVPIADDPLAEELIKSGK